MKTRTTAVVASLVLGAAAVTAATRYTTAAVARTAAAAAPAGTLNLDPVHSMIVFQINHMGASNPFGVFHGLSGTVAVGGDGTPSLDLSVPADKVDMGNDAWEKHIKSPDFFNVAQFPTLTFKSTSAKKAGDDAYEVTGDLTLHGVTKPVTISLTQTGVGKGMKGETRVGYSTTFTIKRAEYGVSYLEGKGVGSDVTLMVNVEGIAK